MKNVQFNKMVAPIACVLTLILGVNSQLLAKDNEDKVKDGIQKVADGLKSAVEKAGDKVDDVQAYFDSYKWKGVLEGVAVSGPVTLDDLKLNDHHRAIVVKPDETIHAKVSCAFNSDQCSPVSVYRVVIGIKGVGAQTTIGTTLGVVAGEGREKFKIKAPATPGLYEVRFRVVEGLTEDHALKAWLDPQGNEPDSSTTIGLIYVKA